MQITFKGTTEQFVDQLALHVRKETWPPPPGVMTVAEYDDWYDSTTFIEIHPFEPPSSLDLPLELEIKASFGGSDIVTVALFKVCDFCPDGIMVEVTWLYSAIISYLNSLLVKWKESGWLKKRLEESRRGPPRLEDRPNVDEMREKARKYQERIERSIPKEVAAQLVGHSRRTLDRWVQRLL